MTKEPGPSNETIMGDMKIAVLGMGHVGLPTALCLAEMGWKVTGADQDSAKIATIKAGKSPFFEPGVQELLTRHLKGGNFRPVEDVEAAIRSSPVLFVCVGTPQKESGEADLTQIEAVARMVACNLNGYKLIIEKSTVPAITAQWIKKTIQRYARFPAATQGSSEGAGKGSPDAADRGDLEAILFDVASNPEFLQEGKAVEGFFHPDRVVYGVDSERAKEILAKIYQPLNCPLLVTDLTTAEIIKHAANAFISTKISFINMVSDMCESVGADITKVSHGIGLDPRIGAGFLQAGIGFGGYCLPKDLRAFIHLGEEQGVDVSFLKEVEKINRRRVGLFLKKVRQALWVIRGKTIGILGLSFKPGTDDIREAPSLRIIETLLAEGAILRLYDPQAAANTRAVFPEEAGRVKYCASPLEAAAGAHALLLLTEWEEFLQLDLAHLSQLMQVPVLVDGRNFFDPQKARAAGFEYLSIGRQ